jgi:TP901 family phage tail tape measure protein
VSDLNAQLMNHLSSTTLVQNMNIFIQTINASIQPINIRINIDNSLTQVIGSFIQSTEQMRTAVSEYNKEAVRSVLNEQQLLQSKEQLRNKLNELAAAGTVTAKRLAEISHAVDTSQTTADIQKVVGACKELQGPSPLESSLKSAFSSLRAMAADKAMDFFRDGIAHVNELNKSLTELSIIYGKSQASVAKYGQQLHDLGLKTGTLTLDLAKNAAVLARQGLAPEEAMKRLEEAARFAKISNIGMDASAQMLSATMKTMSIDAAHASDVFAYLGDATAVSATDLGDAVKAAGGSAQSLGVEFEKVTSWVAVLGSETMESGSKIGESLNSIMSRMNALKETGIVKEDSTYADQLSESLSKVGVKLTDSQGKFRNFGTVMDELGKKWGDLSQTQQDSLAGLVAGASQKSTFKDLMGNYANGADLYEQSLASAGTAQSKFDSSMEGTEAKLNRLKDAWSGLWQTSFNSEAIGAVIDALTKIVSWLDNFLKNLNPVQAALTLTGAAAIYLGLQMKVAAVGGAILEAAMKGLTIAVRFFGASVKAALVTSGIGIALVALGFVAEKVMNKFSDAGKEQEKLGATSKEQVDSLESQRLGLEKLSAEFTALQDNQNKTAEQKERLAQIQQELVEKYGVSATGINAEGKAYSDSTELIEARTKALQQQIDKEKAARASKLMATDTKDRQEISEATEKRKTAIINLNVSQKQLETFESSMSKGVGFRDGKKSVDPKNSKAVEKYRNELSAQISKEQADIENAEKDLQSKLKNRTESIQDAGQDYIKQLEQEGHQISGAQKLFIKEIAPEMAKQTDKSLADQFSNITKVVDKLEKGKFDELTAQFKELKLAVQANPGDEEKQLKLSELSKDIQGVVRAAADGIPGIDQFTEKMMQQYSAANLAQQGTKQVAISMEELGNKYAYAQKSVEPYNKLLQDMAEGKQVNADAVMNLALKEKDLMDAISFENGALMLNKAAVEELRDKKTEAFFEAIAIKEQEIAAIEEQTKIELESVGVKIGALESLTAARQAAHEAAYAEIDGLSPEEKQKKEEEYYNKLAKIIKDREQISKIREMAEMSLKARGASPSAGKSSEKPADESLNEALKEQDVWKEKINLFNAEYEARKKNIELAKVQVALTEKQKDYNLAIRQTLDLMQQQNQAVKDLNEANGNISSEAQSLREIRSDLDTESWFDGNGETSLAYKEYLNTFSTRSQSVHDNKGMSNKEKNKQMKEIEEEKEAVEILFGKLQLLKQAHADNASKVKEMTAAMDASRDSINQYAQNIVDAKFSFSKNWIDEQKSMDALPLEEELTAWKRVIENQSNDNAYFTEIFDNIRQSVTDEAEAERQIQAIREANNQKTMEAQKEVFRVNKEISAAAMKSEDEKQEKLKSFAKVVVDTYKKAQETMRDAELDSIDKQLESEQKRHDKRMKNLDEEMSRFEQNVNDQLNLLDRESESEDYSDELGKKQKEAESLRAQIDTLSLDDSLEGQARKRELEAQLSVKQEEIDRFQLQRSRAERKQSLQDVLETKKREVEATRKAEDEKLTKQTDSLQNLREAREKDWNEKINNDATYIQMEKDIVAGHTTAIEAEMNRLKAGISSITGQIGQDVSNNLTAELENALRLLESVNKGTYMKTEINKDDEKAKDFKQYIQNKREWHDLHEGNPNHPKLAKLEQQNKEFREKYNFPDYSYEETFNDKVFRFHSGGEVGQKTLLGRKLHELLNLGTGEIPAILKQGELVLTNPIQAVGNLLSRIKLPELSLLQPNRAAAAGGNTNYYIDMNVTATGDAAGGKALFSTFVNELRKLGG